MKNKLGQTTVFIIIGILIVASIILFFLFRTGVIPSPLGGFEEDPQKFLENCLEPKIKEGIDLLNKQGGQIDPELSKRFKFSDEEVHYNISYLCYTSFDYVPCVNLEPVLVGHLEDEIFDYISEDVEQCFSDWRESLERLDYSVELGSLNYEVEFEPSQVVVEVERDISATRNEESFQYDGFRVVIRDKIYDLAILAQEILSQEAENCNFDALGYMLFYPEFEIDKFRTSDLSTIYTLEDRKSTEKMRFAVRGCVIPPGV